MRFRKKPVVVNAFQFLVDPIPTWAVQHPAFSYNGVLCEIDTLEGIMTAKRGDWIILGVKGELYPCKQDIFEMTYENVAHEAT